MLNDPDLAGADGLDEELLVIRMAKQLGEAIDWQTLTPFERARQVYGHLPPLDDRTFYRLDKRAMRYAEIYRKLTR